MNQMGEDGEMVVVGEQVGLVGDEGGTRRARAVALRVASRDVRPMT